jgi:Ca2+:H+ antiporter
MPMSGADQRTNTKLRAPNPVLAEWPLFLAIATSAVFLLGGGAVARLLMHPPWLIPTFGWLFLTILVGSKAVVRHAEGLAHELGEPYGTLILTLSITTIEVASISAVMLHGENNPTLARDTIFAILMIILNGMVGLSLLFGGWIHKEQHYNLQGANTYLGVIVPLAILSLILPDFTRTTPGPTLSTAQQAFLIIVALGLYGAFLAIQTGRHRPYFSAETSPQAVLEEQGSAPRPILGNAILLVLYLVPIIYLAELLAPPIDYLIETLHLPDALGAVIIAALVATPEALGAIRAAMANQLQRAMNIFLGSVLATIGLTIPAMLLVGHFSGRHFVLGLEHTDIVMLLLTLFSCGITFGSGRTNVLQGAVHLLLFAVYVLLIFQD